MEENTTAMETGTRTSANNGSETKSLLLEGWKRGGSGRRRLSGRNSVNSLRNDFISRLPNKVRSEVDPEFPSQVDLGKDKGLSEGIEHSFVCCVFVYDFCVYLHIFLLFSDSYSVNRIDNLITKGITVISRCSLCKDDAENEIHLFVNCPVSKNVWDYFGNMFKFPVSQFCDLKGLLSAWAVRSKNSDYICSSLPTIILNQIWYSINLSKFEDVTVNAKIIQIWIINKLRLNSLSSLLPHGFWKRYWHVAKIWDCNVLINKHKKPSLVKWKPPDDDIVKLNTDGAAKDNPGKAGAGGILRNSNGEFLAGFYHYIGEANNIMVELFAIIKGLQLCIKLGHSKIWLVTDGQAVVNILK